MKLGSKAIRGESNAVCLSFSGQTVSEIFTSDVQFQKFALLIKQFQNVLLAIYSFGTYGMPLIDSFKILVELGQTILACSILADALFPNGSPRGPFWGFGSPLGPLLCFGSPFFSILD